MSLRLGTTACLFASLVVFSAGRALAEPARSRVAIVRTASNDKLLKEATTRLRAELVDAGFDVVEVDQTPGDPRAGVEEGDGAAAGFATVSMNRAGAGAAADIWISDHVTGKTVVRRLQVGGAPNAAAVLAIRAMELLRASLLEVAAPDHTTSSPREAPADVVKWVTPGLPKAERVERQPFQGSALGVGALALHGLQGVGLAFGPTLRFSHSIYGPSFGRLTLAGPLVGPELSEPGGTATVRQEFASLDFGVTTRAHPIGAFGFIGLGAFHLQATGSAAAPYRSMSQGVWSFLTSAGGGAVARASDSVAFTAEFMALLLFPQPIVVIDGQDAGKAGAPSLSFSLNLLVGL